MGKVRRSGPAPRDGIKKEGMVERRWWSSKTEKIGRAKRRGKQSLPILVEERTRSQVRLKPKP